MTSVVGLPNLTANGITEKEAIDKHQQQFSNSIVRLSIDSRHHQTYPRQFCRRRVSELAQI